MCKAFDCRRMIFALGYMPVSREKATFSPRKSWASGNFTLRQGMLTQSYLSKCCLLITFFIWCLAPVQWMLIYPRQLCHSNSNSTNQTTARFWTKVQSTWFLLICFLGGKTNVYEEQIRSHDCSYTVQRTQMGRGMLVVKTDDWFEKAVCLLLVFLLPKIDCKGGNADRCLGDC